MVGIGATCVIGSHARGRNRPYMRKMADRLSPTERSAFMARIRGKNTKPELIVRRLLHRLGYRFRIHYKGVLGRPDLAFTARRKAVFVHGCFWHGHEGCRHAHVPATRSEFWAEKFAKNRERDQRQAEAAEAMGWQVLIVWECELKEREQLTQALQSFLGAPRYPD